MRSHSQTTLIDILSPPQIDSWVCPIGLFSANTLSSTLSLAHPVLAFYLVPQPSQLPILPIFVPYQNSLVLLSKIFIFCACGYVFQPTSLLPRASCHLQSSGTTCLRRFEIQWCWTMWLCASKLVGRFIQLDKRQGCNGQLGRRIGAGFESTPWLGLMEPKKIIFLRV